MDKSIIGAFKSGLKKKSIGSAESGFFSRWSWSGGATYSGTNVTVDKALQNDTVWACVKLISESVATLPIHIYKRTADGGRVLANDHYLFDLIHYEPNQDMTAVCFWQATIASVLLWGNAYIFKTYNAAGNKIISLDILDPSKVSIDNRVRGSDLVFTYKNNGESVVLDLSNCMHIKGFSTDGRVGMSAIQYGCNSIGSAIAADKTSDEVFKNASRANGMVTVDQLLSPDQREDIRGHVKTVSDKGGVYVLEKGSSFETFKFNPQDAQLLDSRSFSVETICRWFRVPPVMIGHGDKASSWPTSTEAQGALFLRYVLRCIISSVEQEIRRSLFSPVEQRAYFMEYSIEGLLRGDSKARAEFYASAIQNGWLKPNEARSLENWPPEDGGDQLMIQSSMIPLAKIGLNMIPSALSKYLDKKVENVEN
jgi:HK97 family phage portal protein